MGSLVINNDDDPKSSINAYKPRNELLEHSANSIYQKFQSLFYAAEQQQKSLLNYLQFRHGSDCCNKNNTKYNTTNYHANEKLSCHERTITSTTDNHKLHHNWRDRDDESSIEYSNFIQNYVTTTTLLFNYCNYLVNSSSNHRNTLNNNNDCRTDNETAEEEDGEEEAVKLATQDLDYIDCNINCNNNDNVNINISRTTNKTSSTNHHNQQQQHHHHHQQQPQYYRSNSGSCCTSNSTMSSVGFYAASSFILVLCYLTTLTTALAVDHPM